MRREIIEEIMKTTAGVVSRNIHYVGVNFGDMEIPQLPHLSRRACMPVENANLHLQIRTLIFSNLGHSVKLSDATTNIACLGSSALPFCAKSGITSTLLLPAL